MSTPVESWLTVRATMLESMESVQHAKRVAEEDGAPYAQVSDLVAQSVALRRAYAEALPQIAIGRDPLDGALVTVAFDAEGLDGPYWDAQNPARPAETMAPSFVVLTGAMAVLSDRVEFTEHLCLPGPPMPFVVPELLARAGVTAVLATLGVGSHTGYAVSYYSALPPEGPPLPNEWGRREYWLRESGRPMTMGTSYDNLPEPDFDLGPWIEQAKLCWVAPGDGEFRLRWERDGCPFVDLPGERRFQRIQAGEVF
jgi:hypothetical protein